MDNQQDEMVSEQKAAQLRGAQKVDVLITRICESATELEMTMGELLEALVFARATIPHRILCSTKRIT